ncbi:hypothetical protein AAFF_G00078740 [Aldrovandia affinis]|uniref:Uncharacterized protein n=1 Tax=Aldrovandia affinis TaxID=143900 RepID=A0AAD7WCV6_9TELE|nr:hypothetical protein AAFF_G00078740 [Aldrovandia affinis]
MSPSLLGLHIRRVDIPAIPGLYSVTLSQSPAPSEAGRNRWSSPDRSSTRSQRCTCVRARYGEGSAAVCKRLGLLPAMSMAKAALLLAEKSPAPPPTREATEHSPASAPPPSPTAVYEQAGGPVWIF